MVVLPEMRVADSSIRTAAKWLAGQVETGGSGLARDRINIERDGCVVNEIVGRRDGRAAITESFAALRDAV